jgi:long-chain acyl-CoA synthetase
MKVKIRAFKPTDTSIIGMIENSIKQSWDMPAYTDYGTPLTYTYGDVAKRIAALHLLYRDLGLKPGDKIALCDKNSTAWAVSFLSVLTYGAVVVPILPDFSQEQILNIFTHSDARLMIGSSRLEPKQADSPMPLLDITDWHMSDGSRSISDYDTTHLTASDVAYFSEDPEGLALISYTSGSTGRSKGVMLPYRSIWSNVMFADEVLGLPRGSRTMALLPMAHMYGFAFDFIYEFCDGCHVHYLTKTPSPVVVMNAFSDVKPAIFIAVPLIIEKIVTGKIFPILRTQRVRTLLRFPLIRKLVYRKIRQRLISAFGGEFYEIIVGGAAFNKEVENFLAKIKVPYTVGYGMTECGPIIGYEDWHHFVKGSCGKAAPRMEVRIQSKDPARVPGEILVRGTNVMLGYYKNPTETADALDSDGWLHTGDLGTIDPQGNIFIRGRKKTMLLGANGQNIYPEEIEDTVLSNTYFEECVVVQRGEKLVALVYISDKELEAHGMTREGIRADLDRYRRHLNTLLPKFAGLAGIEMQTEEFEKTPKRSIRRYLYS